MKWTDEDVAAWAAMYERRMTLGEISETTGAPVTTIWNRLRKSGAKLRDRWEDSKTVDAIFGRRWTPEPNTGCWLWMYGTAKAGYGCCTYLGEVGAHRVSYVIHIGPIPSGQHVLHKCDVPQCVNPDHLVLGTNADNMADMARKGRAQRHNAAKTHCPRGHIYAGDNVGPRADGGRNCRACGRARTNARRRANPEKARADERRRYWVKKEQANA